MSQLKINYYQNGLHFLEAKAFPEALEAFKAAMQQNPQDPQPLIQMAAIYRDLHQFEPARDLLKQWIQLEPERGEPYLELAYLFHETGQLEYAVQFYQEALRRDDSLSAAYNRLGTLFLEKGLYTQARAYFQKALSYKNEMAAAHNNLGATFLAEEDRENALPHFRQAVELHPESPEYQLNLGLTLFEVGELEPAFVHLEIAMRLNPKLDTLFYTMAHYLCTQQIFYQASSFYKLVLRGINHFKANIYLRLGYCAEQESETNDALYFYLKALQRTPRNWWIAYRLATVLPWVYPNTQSPQAWRERFDIGLTRLGQFLDAQKPEVDYDNLTLFNPPFQLAYQGTQIRPVVERLAELWCRVLPNVPEAPLQRIKPPGEKIHIGFVSSFFFEHSISRCVAPMIKKLAQAGFQISCHYIFPRKTDSTTRSLQEAVSDFYSYPKELQPHLLANQIRQTKPDILIYPEIGMDPYTYFVALRKLAPIQCVLGGHPVTTGMRSMDYYFSVDAMEPENAQENYTETLVCFDKPFIYYQKPQLPETSKLPSDFGLPADIGTLYLLPQTLFKIHPEMDALLNRLLLADPQAHLVLVQEQRRHWHAKLKSRFQATLPEVIERVHFVPHLNNADFMALLALADVILDSFPFGSGNVAYQAFAVGTPMVTWPGNFACGRYVFTLYHEMGLTDCVAKSPEEYLQIALRLGQDKVYRDRIQSEILNRNGVIFENTAGLNQFIDFIKGLI